MVKMAHLMYHVYMGVYYVYFITKRKKPMEEQLLLLTQFSDGETEAGSKDQEIHLG